MTITSMSGFGVFPILIICLTVVLHLLFAFAVLADANKLSSPSGRPGTFLVGPLAWCLTAVIWGIAGVAVYWAIHHSTLRPNHPDYK
ncbi:MAG TPA: hypothetical protein VG733_01930 [Chthoniobacteraceae bacterium]|nr:hypothetical protein [Chthoniobacteraceae bacterium]